MPANTIQFKADLNRFAQKTGLTLTIALRRIVLDLWRRIIKRMPVDTGRARAAWMVTIGVPSSEVLPPGIYGPPPDPDTSGMKPGQQIFLTNNVPYVGFLEDGSSENAPAGFVRIGMAEIEAEIEHIVASL